MKPKLYIVTGNSMKFRELAQPLQDFFECEQKEWDEPEIQGNAEEIIRHKLVSAYEKFKQPVLVDDVSFHFDELRGFPGPYMKYFIKSMPLYEMGMKFVGTRAKVVCWLGLAFSEKDILVIEGVVEGKIVEPAVREGGDRYFDIFFQADGTDKAMIEYSTEEKNEFSHRGVAMKKLLSVLKDRNTS